MREGDARIFRRHRATAADGWLLAVFSVPETERHRRHILRSELARLGFGMVAPGGGRTDGPRPRLDLIRAGAPRTAHARWRPSDPAGPAR